MFWTTITTRSPETGMRNLETFPDSERKTSDPCCWDSASLSLSLGARYSSSLEPLRRSVPEPWHRWYHDPSQIPMARVVSAQG